MKKQGKEKGASYAKSGVSLEKADRLAEAYSELLPKTYRKGCLALPNGFAGLFDLKAEGLEDALLVMATDGVGTKVKLAMQTGRLRGLGQDLVGMSVNDVLTLGAQPLCFLDYVAFSGLDDESILDLVKGVAEGCELAGCALVGGETAEMPGIYRSGDFDLAGFCVGAVGRDRVLGAEKVSDGDRLIGLRSSGPHSNGYSLIRSIIGDPKMIDDDDLLDSLLQPTVIYVKPVLAQIEKADVHAMAHITGGGLLGNLGRVMPENLCAEVNRDAWPVPETFNWLQKKGNVSDAEMFRTFNMGIGFVIIVNDSDSSSLIDSLSEFDAVEIGQVVTREKTGAAACFI